MLSFSLGLLQRRCFESAPAVVMSFQFSFFLCLSMYLCFLSSSLCCVKSEYPVAPKETYASYFFFGLVDFRNITSLINII